MKWTTLAIAVGAFVLLALERFPPVRRLSLPVLRPHFWTDVVLLLVGFVAGGRLAMEYAGWASDAIGHLGVPRLSGTSAPLWATSALAVVLLDLGNYACHAALHRFGALWEFHKVHHSSRRLDWLATFRSHPIEQLVRRLVAPALLVAVGVPIDAVAVAAAVVTAWAMLNHANLDVNLSFLEPILITPRLHRLHHVPQTSERNLGTLFSVWDRLFMRLTRRDAGPGAPLGVPEEVDTYPQGLIRQLREPFARLVRHASSQRPEGRRQVG